MKPTQGLFFLLVLTGLGGCAPEEPYILSDYRFHQRGMVVACYNDDTATVTQAQTLAEGICQQYDRTARLQLLQPAPILLHNAPMRHDTPLPPW